MGASSDRARWPLGHWSATDIAVGPWAWDARLFGDPASARLVMRYPSLVVVGGDASDSCLEKTGCCFRQAAEWGLGPLPLLLTIRLPQFTRRLAGEVIRRLGLLERDRADGLLLELSDQDAAADLKSGHAMQVMQQLREQGVARWLGLSHPNVTELEWMIGRLPIHLLAIPYGLSQQQAGYRLLAKAAEYGLACLMQNPLTADAGGDAQAFALADHPISQSVLPVFAYPAEPSFLSAMSRQQAQAAWQAWQQSHEPPALPPSSVLPDGV